MNNTFCISFSDINFQLLHVSSQENALSIHSAKNFKYPSINSLDQFLSEDNINFISNSIDSFRRDHELNAAVTLSIVLPFNYAEVKKVLLPINSNKDLKRQQIKWELETTLTENIENYKISVLNERREENHIQAIVVAIKKDIIKKLQIIARQNMADINNVLLNCFWLENVLNKQEDFDISKNYMFLKVDKNYLEHHFFCGNKYLLSQIDLLENMSRPREEVIVEITNERYKNISNFIDKDLVNNPLELFVYGSSVSDGIFKALEEGLSSRVRYARVENFPTDDSYKYIEAWGTFL